MNLRIATHRLIPAATAFALCATPALPAAGTAATPFESRFGTISFEIEKDESSFHYWYRPIPKDEQSFVHEIRRYVMQGKLLAKPVFVTASNRDSLDPLFRPMASYLALAKRGDLPGILNLFDSEDRKKAAKIFTPDFERHSLAWMSSVDAFEYRLLVRDGPYVFAVGFVHRGGATSPWTDTFKYSEGVYHMSAGLSSVSTLWLEPLGYILQERGYGAIRAAGAVSR